MTTMPTAVTNIPFLMYAINQRILNFTTMRHLMLCLLVGLLFCGCAPSTSTDAAGSVDSSNTATAPDGATETPAGATTVAVPADFAALSSLYPTEKSPYGRWKEDLNGTWEAFPEQRFAPATMQKFFYGTPGFPKSGDDVRFCPYIKLDIGSGRWMLLTYESTYGHTLIGSIFDANGKVLDGMAVYREGEDPYEIRKYFLLDDQGSLNLYFERPKDDGSGNEDPDFTRDTTTYVISGAGKFQKN